MAVNTPLLLKFDILRPDDPQVNSTLCESIFFVELTGVYSSANPSGWSPPFTNPTIASVDTATLDITLADDTVVTLDLRPDFPNTDLAPYEITGVMLGLDADTAITDWIAKMVYTVSGTIGGEDYTESTTKYVPVLCQTMCCVNRLALLVSGCGCDDETAKKNAAKYLNASANLDAIYASLNCTPQNPDKANEILTYLTDLCAGDDCGCQ